jgi:hypothetical protein
MTQQMTPKEVKELLEKHDRAETCECLYDSGHKMCNKPTHVVVDDNGEAWKRNFAGRDFSHIPGGSKSVPRYTVRWPLCLEHSKQFDALKPSISITDFVSGNDANGKYLEGRERRLAIVKPPKKAGS